jgi:aminoglycoside phosphotransferase (APT) family kinase protein
MDLPIPATVDGLDTDWFRSAFAACHNEVRVESARVVEVIEGTCTKIRVALDYAPGGAGGLPSRMLVKGGFASHSAMFLGMHLTEMRYYRDIAGPAVFDTPACFVAAKDPASGRSLVVLEDLETRPVRWLDALEPLDQRDVTAFLDDLAAFAAQYWQSPELAPDGKLGWVIDSYSAEAAAYIDHYLEPERWNHFLRQPRCACLPHSLHDRDRMRRAIDQLARRLERQVITLSHGDVHPGNLYINPDGRPGFLDAQPRRAHFSKDLTYHLVAALDIEDRRRWERPLLARYLRKLAEHGVPSLPSLDELWDDYRAEIAYGLFIFMINESHFQKEEVNTAYAARFGAAAIDHRTFG